jgi:hypothetical protein
LLILSGGCEQSPATQDGPEYETPSPEVVVVYTEPDERLSRESTIAITLSEKPEEIDITVEPYIDIVHMKMKTVDGQYTCVVFYPAQPFEEDTVYEVTVSYGPSLEERWQFGPYNLFNAYSCFPYGENVPLDTPIYVHFMRGRADSYMPAELILKPGEDVLQVVAEETGIASVDLIANPTRQLEPDTTYTAILSYCGDERCAVWEFTTEK